MLAFFVPRRQPSLTLRTEREQCSYYVLVESTGFGRAFTPREVDMLKTFVEEAASLTSIILFVGTVAVWAQVIPQL